MKFYDIDSVFTFGKYEGETLAEVYEKDPKYIAYCQENIDEFYIAPDVLRELKTVSRDNKLLTKNLDEMDDEELADFMSEMNDIDDFDESKLEEDFDWDKEDENLADDEYDGFDEDDEDDEYIDEFGDSYDDNY